MPEAKDSEVIIDPHQPIRIKVERYRPEGGKKYDGWDTIYEQTVEKLNLQEVIKAVNYTQVTLFTVDEVEAVKNVETVNPGAKTDD